MATFVLVHGAWHGGWCWRKVAEPLRAAGHAVHTPTLTGLGERAHLAHSDVDLDTHIADVIGRVRTPVVLVSARDDPAVPRARFAEVLRAAGDNPWIAARETRRGGHFGFHVSYGADYLGDVLRLMMNPEVLRSWTGQRIEMRQATPTPIRSASS